MSHTWDAHEWTRFLADTASFLVRSRVEALLQTSPDYQLRKLLLVTEVSVCNCSQCQDWLLLWLCRFFLFILCCKNGLEALQALQSMFWARCSIPVLQCYIWWPFHVEARGFAALKADSNRNHWGAYFPFHDALCLCHFDCQERISAFLLTVQFGYSIGGCVVWQASSESFSSWTIFVCGGIFNEGWTARFLSCHKGSLFMVGQGKARPHCLDSFVFWSSTNQVSWNFSRRAAKWRKWRTPWLELCFSVIHHPLFYWIFMLGWSDSSWLVLARLFLEDHELKKSGSLHHVEMQQSLCTLWWETHVLQGQYMYNHIISCHLRSCHEYDIINIISELKRVEIAPAHLTAPWFQNTVSRISILAISATTFPC